MDETSLMTRKRKPLKQLTLPNDANLSLKKRRPSNEEPQRRAGTITRMVLKNFMCHSLLDVDLTSNINILIGRNGSGKSAILTALIVGLGGKANLTNRGTNIKGFVKAGQNSGSVEITLWNGGSMAYRPKIYGSKITISRHFTAAGASTYRVKSEMGEVIAMQVREVHNITSSLNIQVDNPICVLNQDTSRNFLSSNNPAHKFALFMKATKLESLSEEYKKIVSNKRKALMLFEDKQASFNKLQDEMKVVKKKMENQKTIVNIRDKLNDDYVELSWAKVRDVEDELKSTEKIVENWETKHRNVLNECATREERVNNIKKNISQLQQQIAELKDQIEVQSRPQSDVRHVISDLRAKYNAKRQEKQILGNTIQSKTRDADHLTREIESANDNKARVEEEKKRRKQALLAIAEKIRDLEDQLQTSRNDLYQFASDIARREEEKQALRREMTRFDSQISNDRNSLNALRNESDNTLVVYGREIPHVKRMIEQNKHKFSQVPRGPLGSYIKLKDKKWAVAVESYLTPNLLRSFAVDNQADGQLLRKILQQACTGGSKPTVITSRFYNKKHDVRNNLVQAPPDCVSVYDALEIDDPIVANCIVDQMGVEGILLIPTNKRAIELMSDASHVPRNCKQGVTIEGDKYFPDPNYKSYGSRYHRAEYLQVDTKEHTLQLERNIQSLMEKKRRVETQCDSFNAEIRQQDAKKSQLEEKIRKLNNARAGLLRQLEELRATAEPETANVEILESELKEVREVILEKKAQLGLVEEALKEIKAGIGESEDKLKHLKESSSGFEDRMRALEGQINEENIRQKEIATSDEFDKRKAKEIEAKLNEVRAKMMMNQSEVRQLTEQAVGVGERPERLRKVTAIVAEIEQLERSVKRIETDTENIDDLMAKHNEMLEKLGKVSKMLSTVQNNVKDLNTAYEQRTRHYRLTEDYFVTYVKHSFKKIMEVRQFDASMEVNIPDKKLELIVVPQHGSQGQTTTSNLSGGERSFSTVAFLYSLWQCMEFPFYFLDEFDVYMDKMNRTKVFEILIHHAENNPELQFVFLTPQEISFMQKNISVLKLQDPERNV